MGSAAHSHHQCGACASCAWGHSSAEAIGSRGSTPGHHTRRLAPSRIITAVLDEQHPHPTPGYPTRMIRAPLKTVYRSTREDPAGHTLYTRLYQGSEGCHSTDHLKPVSPIRRPFFGVLLFDLYKHT